MRWKRRQHDKPKNRRALAACEYAVMRFRLAVETCARNRRALGLPEVPFVDLPDDERQVYYAGADALLAHDTVPLSHDEAAHVRHA